jgi:bla regulator protein blaR1
MPSIHRSLFIGRGAVAGLFAVAVSCLAGSAIAGDDYTHSYGSSPGTNLEYAVFAPDGNTMSANITHRLADLSDEARRENSRIAWFREGDREYVSRDAATVERAAQIVEPQGDLGRRMGELGGEQGRIGAIQGRIGALQGRLGEEQGRLATREQLLDSAMEDASVDERQDLRHEIAALRDRQDEISRQIRELGREQADLGRQSEILGAEEAELGRQQREVLPKVFAEMRRLLHDTLANGRTQPLD